MKALKSTTMLVTAGLAALAAFGTSTAAAHSSDRDGRACTNGRVPVEVRGNPGAIRATEAGDAYIFHNRRGWHLRMRHKGSDELIFTGTISTGDGKKVAWRGFRLESHDSVLLSPDKTSLTFQFKNYGHIDGLDLRMNCSAKVTFDLQVAGAAMAPERIHLGRNRVAASSNPITFDRS